MDHKTLENVLQIPITFEPGQNSVDFQINSQQYKQYIAVNPKVTTFMSWVNISEKIGNNKIQFISGINLPQTNAIDVFFAIILKRTNFYYNPLGRFIEAFDQGDQPDLTQNCLAERTFVWNQGANLILESEELLFSEFFSSTNFEQGSFSNVTGVNNPSSSRIRLKGFYKINGQISLSFQQLPSTPQFLYDFCVYNPDGSFNSALSLFNWQVMPTSPTPLIINIPYNQGYTVRFAFRRADSADINPSVLDSNYFTASMIDYSAAARKIASEPIEILTNPFSINISTSTFPFSFRCSCYDELGNFISNSAFFNTTITVNVPNTKYIVISGEDNSAILSGPPDTNSLADAQNKITSISYFLGLPAINKIITIPDGYYSGLVSSPEQTGFMSIIDLINNDLDFQSVGGILSVNTLTFQTKFEGNYIVNFLGNKESSNRLFGYYNDNTIVINGTPVISSDSIDLFSDGRFSAINIIFTSLASMGYTNETTSIISIPAINGYGKLIRENDISYMKLIPKTSVLSTLSFRIVDNNGNPIELNDRLYLRFEIRAYN